jgi:UDP-glucose 4-epimerase
VKVVKGARRPGDPGRLVADPKRANEGLSWTPTHSSITEIVETAWAWHRRKPA